MRRRIRRAEAAASVAVMLAALVGVGAARVPSAEPGALCIPILMDCSTPSPTPTPTPTGGGSSGGSGSGSTSTPVPGGGILPIPGLPGDGNPIVGTPTPPDVGPDPDAPVMTQPSAQLAGSSLEVSGLHSVSFVTVPLADGSRIPVVKIEADFVAMDDFSLDVRKDTSGDASVTDSSRMELHGNVKVYLNSITASTSDGQGFSLGAQTPVTGAEVPSHLLKVNLGLVGVTGDSISFTPTHQYMHSK